MPLLKPKPLFRIDLQLLHYHGIIIFLGKPFAFVLKEKNVYHSGGRGGWMCWVNLKGL